MSKFIKLTNAYGASYLLNIIHINSIYPNEDGGCTIIYSRYGNVTLRSDSLEVRESFETIEKLLNNM